MMMKRPAGMVIKRKDMSTLVKRADKALSVKVAEAKDDVAVDKPKTMSKLAKRADKALPGMVAEAKEEVAVDEPMTSKVAKAETTPNIEVDGGKAITGGAEARPKHEEKEQEEVAARSKELKAMPVEDLKKLVDNVGLQRAAKAGMVEAVLEHEAKIRREQQAREARIRAVVVGKKEELALLPVSELKDRCGAAAILGNLPKQDRIERLLMHWQERGGIDRALAKIKSDEREAELIAMSTAELRKLCDKAGVDTLLKEVMVDRLIRREIELGRFAALAPAKAEAAAPQPEDKTDLVATLLANEAARARRNAEEEKQKEREAAAAKKLEELGSTTVAELKRRLSSKGFCALGSKDDLVQALLAQEMEEEALAAKKAELKALGKDGLKELLATKGLEAGAINEMVEALLQHEAKCEEDLRAYEAKVMEQLQRKKHELEAMAGGQLKELCVAKGLSAGTTSEDRVQRLLRHAKEHGEVDRAISMAARAARREALDAMDKGALRRLCDELEVDPLVTQVLVERLLHHEAEAGPASDTEGAQPPAKRQRLGQK